MSIERTESGKINQRTLTILVSRPQVQLLDFCKEAGLRNVKVIPFPLNLIEPCLNLYSPQMIRQDLLDCSWLLFTSANGVGIFFAHLLQQGIGVPRSISIGVIGKKTGKEVEKYGFPVALCPVDEIAEGLLSEFLSLEVSRGRPVMLPTAEKMRPVLVDGLREAGFRVRKYDVYRTVRTPADQLPPLDDTKIDYYCFLSSSAVERFHELFGQPNGRTVSIGAITTATMRECGWKQIKELPESNLDRLWEIIDA